MTRCPKHHPPAARGFIPPGEPKESIHMATSFGALCTDFYVNQKLALKMDLPSDRETILHMFDQVKKAVPAMRSFRRYDGELALESSRKEAEYQWLALRRTSIRTGHVNPSSLQSAYAMHKLILELAPYHLTVSPLDVDYLELLLGFDLECKANHDQVVFDALFAKSPMANLGTVNNSSMTDCQPIFSLNLTEQGDLQGFFEVRTRTRTRKGGVGRSRNEPISVFLTLKKFGPITNVEDLPGIFDQMATLAEQLAANHLVPSLLAPIARQIPSNNA